MSNQSALNAENAGPRTLGPKQTHLSEPAMVSDE